MRYLALMLVLVANLTFAQAAIPPTYDDGYEAGSDAMLIAAAHDEAIASQETLGSHPLIAISTPKPPTADIEVPRNKQTFATYMAGVVTRSSTGESTYGVKTRQSNSTGWGTAAEYRRNIRGGNYGGILFSDTPTMATLNVQHLGIFSWPTRRYEFDLLWTYEFAPVRNRFVPYVTSGIGAIALNGGSASGWDRQAAWVGGAGGDVRLARALTLRAGFTLDSLKASTYDDPTYRSTGTVMVEPRVGLVWGLGSLAFHRRNY